ncbi:MAG: class I SAM-dependent methyltransferase [Promethearchaeota archaeon]
MITDKHGFEALKDELRQSFLEHLHRAYQLIPPINNPRILDIGCGSGVPTLELARISGGDVTGLDIDRDALQRFQERSVAAGLGDQIHIVEGSLKKMEFPPASFDILWAEGSIFIIGFKKGLKNWKHFLKPGGYLVVHDAADNLDQKIHDVEACGYQLVDWFILGIEMWWVNYYEPLKQQVQQIWRSNPTDPELKTALHQAEQEIQGYHKHPSRYQSVYFIMQYPD